MEAPPPTAGFKVTARMILELGAELISSDGIALYELIKNAYDAGSKRVLIRARSVFLHSSFRNAMGRIDTAEKAVRQTPSSEPELVDKLVREIEGQVDLTADRVASDRFREIVRASQDLMQLRRNLGDAYRRANTLEIIDTGEGMSLRQLEDVFLTIGTRSRLDAPTQHYVGGKGIGRLSTMRLADQLTVRTTRAGEKRWNVLDIDWRRFSHDSAETLDEIRFRPSEAEDKSEPQQSGTRIELNSLKADWNVDRARRLASTQLDRLFDPFAGKARYPVLIRVNQRSVPIPTFDRRILAEAQARAEIRYFIDDDGRPQFSMKMDYLVYNKTKVMNWDETDILGITSKSDVSVSALSSLGPFTAHFHWFNRQRLSAVDGIGTREAVRGVVNHWANGLLMYRDGFRVNPYGAPDDDWLGIDFKALGSSGYKVNRKQLIGAVNISARDNPYLVDQTNREGLRTSEEKTVLVVLLTKAVTEEFRTFLNMVEREERKKARLDAKDTSAFLESVSARVRRSLKELRAVTPPDKVENLVFLDATYAEMEERLRTARDAVAAAEQDQRDLVSLAGIGLLVEIVSHELGRVTRNTLETISSLERDGLPRQVAMTFDTVEGQMNVIRRRLDMLNPLSPSGRNRKEIFDLRELTENILASHAYRFAREGISSAVGIAGDRQDTFKVKAVKGMIIQILENLIDNSVFWLGQQARLDPSFKPSIGVEFDSDARQLLFTDNGPGIEPSRAEDVFRPFISSKPPGLGKGLGLYISKEIARHHGSDLYLLDEPISGRLHTFVLDLAGLN